MCRINNIYGTCILLACHPFGPIWRKSFPLVLTCSQSFRLKNKPAYAHYLANPSYPCRLTYLVSIPFGARVFLLCLPTASLLD